MNISRYLIASIILVIGSSACSTATQQTRAEEVKVDSSNTSATVFKPLPSEAKKVAEGYGVIAYIQTVGKGEMTLTNAVWLTDDKGKNATRVCVSNEKGPSDCDWQKDSHICMTKDILAADEVSIVKDNKTGNTYIVVSGVPDNRNIYSYLIPVSFDARDQEACYKGEKECIHIHASEEFAGHDEKTNTLSFYSYGYNEDSGRYRFKKTYDFNGKLVSKGNPEEY